MKDSDGWAMSVSRVRVELWIFDWMTRPEIGDLLHKKGVRQGQGKPAKWESHLTFRREEVVRCTVRCMQDWASQFLRGEKTLGKVNLRLRQRYTPLSLSTAAGMCRSLFSLMYMSVSGNWEKVSGTVSMRLLLKYSISSCGINLKIILFSSQALTEKAFHIF